MQNVEYLLEMTNICKSFPGVIALDKVSFNLKAGSIHALMGENGAGKSTLMKCLFGIYKFDSGSIKFVNEEVVFSSPKHALEKGIAMVHQELNQVLQMTVADNIWLGRYPNNFGIVCKNQYYENTLEILKELELDIDPYIKMDKLSVSDRQMIEIAKAISYDAKVIVLDEPTSSLADEEVNRLFKIINKLKSGGCGIIYISHKMEEIFNICDTVTVMRDGNLIASRRCVDVTTDEIISLMVGRKLENRYPEKKNIVQEQDLVQVRNISGKYEPCVKNISFDLKKGEILGVAGLAGAGRTELLQTIFGLNSISCGEIYINQKRVFNKSPQKSLSNGFALLTEERRKNGIFASLDITFNLIIACLKSLSKYGIINSNKITSATQWVIEKLNVKVTSPSTKIKNLSGGNQQKVILGRLLLTEPEVLLLDEPTRGIDVGAKFEIYQLIINLASKGKGVIVVSSEMPELLGICDRIMVISNGRIAGIESVDVLTQERIMELSAKYI